MATWRQKGDLCFATKQRRDQVHNTVATYLAGVNTDPVHPPFIQDDDSRVAAENRWCLSIVVNYLTQADADHVWADIQTASGSNWFVSGSWITYYTYNDDGSVTNLGRIDVP